jgi:glycosyltransferase involved in cell wall biosynthesis
MTRILLIIPSLQKGGAERIVIDIVRELRKQQFVQVYLVIFQNKIDYEVEDIADLIHIIPSKVVLSAYKTNKSDVKDLQKFITTFNPDIIHTHLFEAEIVSRQCCFPSAKWYSHCHDNMQQFRNFGFDTLFSKKLATNFLEKRFLFKCYKKNGGTRFIAISNDTLSYFENTAQPYSVTRLLNAINYSRFLNKKTRNGAEEIIHLINVGSFVDKKNQTFLIDVALVLFNRGFPFHLHLLGDGVNKTKIREKISNLGLEKCISLLGNVENVETHLEHANIYLHSATYEPLGLVLIEAMAAGLPVITLDGKGNRDLIIEGENGYMIFENNPVLFANKIISLWNKKAEYNRVSVFAQKYAKQFDISLYIENLLNIYNT